MAVTFAVVVASGEGERGGATAGAPLGTLDGLDEFITTGMAEWQVPGLAIGVIAEGKVVLAKGYGRRDVERNLPATTRTVMAVASVTKSFTALLLGMLVEEKKIEWDRPVRDYMPDFRLAGARPHQVPCRRGRHDRHAVDPVRARRARHRVHTSIGPGVERRDGT